MTGPRGSKRWISGSRITPTSLQKELTPLTVAPPSSRGATLLSQRPWYAPQRVSLPWLPFCPALATKIEGEDVLFRPCAGHYTVASQNLHWCSPSGARSCIRVVPMSPPMSSRTFWMPPCTSVGLSNIEFTMDKICGDEYLIRAVNRSI